MVLDLQSQAKDHVRAHAAAGALHGSLLVTECGRLPGELPQKPMIALAGEETSILFLRASQLWKRNTWKCAPVVAFRRTARNGCGRASALKIYGLIDAVGRLPGAAIVGALLPRHWTRVSDRDVVVEVHAAFYAVTHGLIHDPHLTER
ncbi:hypothetical protein [Dactylosporangium sp. NPDC051541]|uniref:hypothetical protein n=1 Tax=Dactylosporangium sp. NPDC051541 TaxID=3363977 RepID=UPI0037BDFBA6